jgi:tripartite-type tricarboxylate transporter receptor subunit TctC
MNGEMMFKRLIGLGVLLLGTTVAMAQEFPKKQPIKIVVTSNAGGLTDSLARVTAEFLQHRLGQAVVVENRVGAGGSIGADYVAKAPADGYTLLFAGAELAVLPAVRSNLPYKFDEFTYLIRPFTLQPLMMVSPKLPVSSIPELISYMKTNPGKARYGSTGVGAIVHLGTAMFEGSAGVKGRHVPYTGIAPVYQDLLAGNVDFLDGGSVPFLEGIKVIGSAGTKRSPIYPDLPTLEESGIKNAGWDVWFAFIAPPNLPKPIADRLITEMSAVFKDPAAVAKFLSTSKSVPEANMLTGDALKKQVIEDNVGWKGVAVRESITVQQ